MEGEEPAEKCASMWYKQNITARHNNVSITAACCFQTSELLRWDKVASCRHNREAITASDEKQIDCTVFQPVAKIPQGRENELLSKMSSASQEIGHSSFPVLSWGQTLYCTLDPSHCSTVRSCCCSLEASTAPPLGCMFTINEGTLLVRLDVCMIFCLLNSLFLSVHFDFYLSLCPVCPVFNVLVDYLIWFNITFGWFILMCHVLLFIRVIVFLPLLIALLVSAVSN